MEGLLPMVYKAIKRNRSRQKYECLSSGAAHSYMNISDDMYVELGPNYKTNVNMMMRSTSSYSSESKSPTQNMKGHRRHQSYAFGMSTPEIRNTIREDDVFGVGNKKAQLVRFRSHRFKMFSCVGGC